MLNKLLGSKIVSAVIAVVICVLIVTSVAFAGDKVTVCHKENGNGNVCITKEIPVEALPAHLGHGDTLGPCADVDPTATNIPATAPAEPTATAIPTEKPAEPTATPARIQPTATLPAVPVNTESVVLVADDACPAQGDCLCRVASALETQTALMATQVSLQATQVAQQSVCAVPSNTGMNQSGLGLSALTDKMAPYLKDAENFLATPLGIFVAILGLAALFAAAFYFTREPAPKTPARKEGISNQ